MKWGNVGCNNVTMEDRRNTIVCIFYLQSLRISAYQIHEWFHDELHLQEEDVRMIQIDWTQRQVYVKFVNNDSMMVVLRQVKCSLEHHHENGELSLVTVEVVGLGVKNVRISNLPPETPDETIRSALSTYGEVKKLAEELWSSIYRYQVSNGVRLVEIVLKNTSSHT